MSGWLAVAGLGPGDEALVTEEVRAALAEATDVIGYIPYVARVAPREGLMLHPSDNRVELDRATGLDAEPLYGPVRPVAPLAEVLAHG